MTTSSTSNFLTTRKPQPNQISRIVTSTLYRCTAPSNILHQMQKISKTLWTLWQGIYPIKKWTLPRQITLRILMALAIPSGTLSHWCIRLTGTLFILIIRPWLLKQKSHSNSLQKLLWTLVKTTRKSLNTFQ